MDNVNPIPSLIPLLITVYISTAPTVIITTNKIQLLLLFTIAFLFLLNYYTNCYCTNYNG